MQGKTVVITGATSGIGEIAALRLAKKGARILFAARDKARAEATLAKLNQVQAGENEPIAAHGFHLCDLSLLAEQKRLAGILAAEPRIDVLVNNAGALFNRRAETADGLERTFALNHMSYFTVTVLLLDKLKATPGARIVSTSSAAHRSGKLDLDDLQARKSYRGFRVYGTTKLENILFTRALAKRLAGTGVTANCLHPGFVATRFADASGGLVGGLAVIAKRLTAITPEEGAKTIVYLASDDAVAATSGAYFYKCRPEQPSAAAQNDSQAEELWRRSAEIAGLD